MATVASDSVELMYEHLRAGNWPEVTEIYERGLGRDEKLLALHRAGRNDDAERQLRRTLRRFGPTPNVTGELGELLLVAAIGVLRHQPNRPVM